MSGDSRMVVGVLGVIPTSYRNQNLEGLPVITYGEGIQKRKSPQLRAGGFREAVRAFWAHTRILTEGRHGGRCGGRAQAHIPPQRAPCPAPAARDFVIVPRPPQTPPTATRTSSMTKQPAPGTCLIRAMDKRGVALDIWITLASYPHTQSAHPICPQQPYTT